MNIDIQIKPNKLEQRKGKEKWRTFNSKPITAIQSKWFERRTQTGLDKLYQTIKTNKMYQRNRLNRITVVIGILRKFDG